MLKYIHNIRLAASRVCHYDWSKYDQYCHKKKRFPSSFENTVGYALWVMFVNTSTGLANSPDVLPDHCGSSGVNSSFLGSLGSGTNIIDFESQTKPELFTNKTR